MLFAWGHAVLKAPMRGTEAEWRRLPAGGGGATAS